MKGKLVILAVLITALMSITTVISTSKPTVASTQNPFQFATGTENYPANDITMPQKGITFTDQNFHTSIVRITDKSDGYSDNGIENEYSRIDSENCNGSFLILRANDAELYLYDTTTYQLKNHFENIFLGMEPEPRWDAYDPKIFYYVYGTELRSYNIDNNFSTTIHDFNKEFPSAAYITTKVEGDASLDRRYWSFIVEDSDYNLLSVIVYDKTANRIVGQKSIFPDALDWVSMDMSGKHCLIGYDTYVTQVFPRDFSTSTNLTQGANGHMDLALTTEGNDVVVYQNNANDWIAMSGLDNVTETKLVKIPFDINPDIGVHISGNCASTPGWVLVSTYGSKNPPTDSTHSWMDTQLFMVELRANPTIWRIAHTHSYLSLDFTGEKNYFAETFASINTRGTKIYFGSNWGNFTSDYTDTYVATLPQGWLTTVPFSNIPEFSPLAILSIVLLIALTVTILSFAKNRTKISYKN